MYLNKNDFQIAKEKFNDCGYIIFEELLSNEDVQIRFGTSTILNKKYSR